MHFTNVTVYGLEPKLVREMKNVTVPKGKDAVFTCEVHDLGGHRVSTRIRYYSTVQDEIIFNSLLDVLQFLKTEVSVR
jgi:hypothetical protein